jgi:TonB family protein
MLFNWIRISLAAVLALSIVRSTPAQNEQVNALVAPMADSIARSKNKTVVVFDFSSADPRLGQLGTVLADDFSAALAASGRKLQLEDRSRLKKMMDDNGLEPRNIHDDGIAPWLAADLGAKVLVLGTLEWNNEIVNLSATSYSAKDGKGIALFKVAIPLTDEMKKLILDTAEKDPLDNSVFPSGKCTSILSIPCSGTAGYSLPKCVRCPSPPFSGEAVKKKAQGTVLVMAVIDVNGRARDVKAVKALPYGLTLQAIQAVQKWTFQPATGPDGKPAAVRQLIEVTFHLY